MRLLPRVEVKQLRDEETERLVKERAAYSDASAREVAKFNALKAAIEQKSTEMFDLFKQEQSENIGKINALKKEVVDLENRRKKALEPVEGELLAARQLRYDAEDTYKTAKASVEASNALRMALNEDRKLFETTKKGVDEREKLLLSAEEQFSKNRTQIMATLDRREAKIVEKEEANRAKDEELISKDWRISKMHRETLAEKAIIEKMTDNLAKREKKLAYDQQILANAFAEAKLKKII